MIYITSHWIVSVSVSDDHLAVHHGVQILLLSTKIRDETHEQLLKAHINFYRFTDKFRKRYKGFLDFKSIHGSVLKTRIDFLVGVCFLVVFCECSLCIFLAKSNNFFLEDFGPGVQISKKRQALLFSLFYFLIWYLRFLKDLQLCVFREYFAVNTSE